MTIGLEGASSHPAVPLHLELLGGAVAIAHGIPVARLSKKGLALFAYLALDRRPHSRNALAALLWGARDPEAARGSLRTTLSRLPRPMAACLAIGRDSVTIAGAAVLVTDVGRFEALARADDVVRMTEASNLYRGHLLQDFDPGASPEFDDWLDRERTRLAQLAHDVFDRAIRAHCTQLTTGARGTRPPPLAAVAIARQWLSIEPAAERAHRWLIRMHIDAGNAEAAHAHFESCKRALAVAEGRTPDRETLSLVESTSAALNAAAPVPSATRQPSLAAPPAIASTSFVGRGDEVAEIARLLNDPACRLLTLHGLGGVGKTRLAHSVMQRLADAFPEGVAWVSLEGVERPSVVADTMARALGIDVPPGTPARETLLARLQSRRQLIVLDNFEHLLSRPDADAAADDPVDLLLGLLRVAPGVRLLVTSRETLAVQEEWVFGVDGLGWRVPDDSSGEAVTLPAVELFTQRARQASLGFSPSTEMPSVLRICERVQGLPLGIELAAAWVRTIACAEIARELDRGLDIPPSLQRNRPERQQSLRAVIDFSWRLLADEESHALCALSAFRGGFTREAAEVVASAPLRMLSALVDKALVQRGAEGRYSLHPLVRHYAAEQLARSAPLGASIRQRHADHYLRRLRETRDALYGEHSGRATRELEKDLDNVRAAWATTVATADTTAVRESARPLCLIFDRLGLYEEWTRTFDEALAAFERIACEGAQAARQALALSAAYGHWRRGDPARARGYRAQVDEWIASASDASERADLHKLCGLIDREGGDLDSALRHFAAGAEAARTANDVTAQAQLANEIGVVHWRRGDLASARDAFLASLDACNARGNVFDVPMCLHNIAFCDLELGRFDSADEGFERALQMYRNRANARGEAMVLSSLGILARRRGDLERAETLSRACLALAERAGSPGAVADAIDDLAQVVERRGALVEADALYRRALAMARELGLAHLQCMALLHLARTQAAAGTPMASARSLLEALVLADDHDIHAGRMIAILGAAGLRIAQEDPEAATTARRWRDSVLAVAGANVDVKEAVPRALRTDEAPRPGKGAPDQALRRAANEALDFLRKLAADR